jgi:hypothetical protein
MHGNVPPAADGRVLLGLDFVFVSFSFTFLPFTLDHLPRLASAAGLLTVVQILFFDFVQNSNV